MYYCVRFTVLEKVKTNDKRSRVINVKRCHKNVERKHISCIPKQCRV